MTNLVKLEGGKAVPKNERCDAVKELRELLDILEKDNIPYNHAIVVLVSDDVEDDDKAGFKTATINLPAYESLGVLRLADAALLSRLVG